MRAVSAHHFALGVSSLTNLKDMGTSQVADSGRHFSGVQLRRPREIRGGSGSLFSKSVEVFGVVGARKETMDESFHR